MSDPTRVKIRGIYTTALTERCRASDDLRVVQASPPIRERFDPTFDHAPADASIWTTDDRQGVGVVGAVEPLRTVLDGLGIDTLQWDDPAPRGAIVDATVTDTKGSGAVLDLGEREGFLPFDNTDDHVESGDTVRVQVEEPRPPWERGRPVLDTTLRVQSELLTLVRGGNANTRGQPELADLLPTDPPEGWATRWHHGSDDADLDALGDALETAVDRAETVEDSLQNADTADATDTPRTIHEGEATLWVWFGRESRFALDEQRREVTTTMPGHHRIKAGDTSASAAVDFVEAVAEDGGGMAEDTDFPFAAVTRQFGPTKGDRVAIDHGKPDGRRFRLGRGEVVEYDPDGTVRIEREMSPGGTYDALGVDRQAGDVASTKLTEGKWWYPTVYRGQDGDVRGTYVNVCTPIEIFPSAVRYVDLHVDVVKHTDGTVERVDDDELDAAVAAGHISEALAEKARNVAGALENAL